MHVFVEEFTARDPMGTFTGKNSRRVNQADVRRIARYVANHLIQPGVSAKAKRVEILSAHEAILGSSEITEGPQRTSDAKLEFGVLRIYICRREVHLQGFRVRPRFFE